MTKRLYTILFLTGLSSSLQAQTYFKPDTSFCKVYFSDWLWQCQGTKSTTVKVDPLTNSDDSFINSLTATNKISYSSKCELWPEKYDAKLDIDGRSQAIKLSKDGGVSSYSFSKTLQDFNPQSYKFQVSLENSTAVKKHCDLKVITNISTVEFGPLTEMVKYIRSESSKKIDLKESIIELKTLPAAWSDLSLLDDDIDGYILDLEDELAFAEGDEVLIQDINDQIAWFNDLKQDIKSGLEISTKCSENIEDNSLCLKIATDLKTKIDEFIDSDVAKLEAFEAFTDSEIKRLEGKNADYVSKLNTLLGQIKRILDKYKD